MKFIQRATWSSPSMSSTSTRESPTNRKRDLAGFSQNLTKNGVMRQSMTEKSENIWRPTLSSSNTTRKRRKHLRALAVTCFTLTLLCRGVSAMNTGRLPTRIKVNFSLWCVDPKNTDANGDYDEHTSVHPKKGGENGVMYRKKRKSFQGPQIYYAIYKDTTTSCWKMVRQTIGFTSPKNTRFPDKLELLAQTNISPPAQGQWKGWTAKGGRELDSQIDVTT